MPSLVWHEEVLAPQFEAEARDLLGWYRAVEKAIVAEQVRLGQVDPADGHWIAVLVDRLREQDLVADPAGNSSDIAFAVEQHVRRGLPRPVPTWHVDRSRNDMQACAQVMFGRDRLLDVADGLLELVAVTLERAEGLTEVPMPGYTHLQAAQVVSPGFYLAALSGELHVLRRLDASYAEVDLCPLGAGAMSGQEHPWDRARSARLLGFGGVQPHALTSVASRAWVLGAAGDLSMLGVTLSRFMTDLMAWASGAYGFVDLPDELCGISSAMPQKRNFPVLERIRGRTAHLTTLYADLATGQRGTPYANMVEVSKEAGAHLATLFRTAVSTLRLARTVLAHLRFLPTAMRAACEREYLGGMALAGMLTERHGIEWRVAQIVAGRYISHAVERGVAPANPDPELLQSAALEYGHVVEEAAELLVEAFAVDPALRRKRSAGSAHPDAVHTLLAEQRAEHTRRAADWAGRRQRVTKALDGLDRMLGVRPDTEVRSVVGAGNEPCQ